MKTTLKKQTQKLSTPNLVAVGSVAYDILHTPATSTGKVLGGAAIHFANGASFFTSVGVIGVVGEDYKYKDIDFLRKRDVDLSGIKTEKGQTFLWEGRYHENFLSRETIRTELGVFSDFKPDIPAHYLKPKVLFLAAIEPRLQLEVLSKIQRPKLVALDTFKLWIDIARNDLLKVIKQSDMFIINDDEVRWLTNEYNLFKGAEILRRMGPKWVIVKKGEHGSFLSSSKGIFLTATYPVDRVVDPTGAGDAYAGGVLGYLAGKSKINETEICRAMRWASVVGSFYVEGFGPDGLIKKKFSDLKKRYDHLNKMIELP